MFPLSYEWRSTTYCFCSCEIRQLSRALVRRDPMTSRFVQARRRLYRLNHSDPATSPSTVVRGNEMADALLLPPQASLSSTVTFSQCVRIHQLSVKTDYIVDINRAKRHWRFVNTTITFNIMSGTEYNTVSFFLFRYLDKSMDLCPPTRGSLWIMN
jgi:hypothetical protein